MAGRIFISYRRDDTKAYAGRIFDYLESQLKGWEIFMDVDKIKPGEDFMEVVKKELNSCDVVIVLIGERWQDITDDEGTRRLDKPDDFVRIEIETAIRLNKRIIPVLLDHEEIPKDLPGDLQKLFDLNFLVVRHESFGVDVWKLRDAIQVDNRDKILKLIFIGIFVVIIAVISIVLYVKREYIGTILFPSSTPTQTATATITETPKPPTVTPTSSPSPTTNYLPIPTVTATPKPTTRSETPTITLTPSQTITPAYTLPAISEAECVPKGTVRQKAYVIEALDGETLKVRIEGDIYLVKYIGLRAPDRDDYYGLYTHYENVDLVVDHWVTLVIDANVQESEAYLLRYVFVDDLFANYELIGRGYAYAESENPAEACVDFFEHAQGQAQLAPVGMWKPTKTPWPTPKPGEAPCSCAGDLYNCDDFPNQSTAQTCFEYCTGLVQKDVHDLDGNNDNRACQ